MPVILNPAPVAPYGPRAWELADVVIVNEVEAAAFAPAGPGAEPSQWAASLLRHRTRTAIVTLGPLGCVVAERGSPPFALPPLDVVAIDSVGAGDAFCGALAVRLAEGADVRSAATFASAAGALATTKPGAAPSLPERAAIEALIRAR